MGKLEHNATQTQTFQLGAGDIHYRVLLIEDNPGDARLVYETLRPYSNTVDLQCVVNLDAAIQLMTDERFDIVLLDLSLPDSSGLDTLRKILSSSPDVAVVVLTGTDDDNVGDEAVKSGAQSYLVKGQYDDKELMRILRHANERQRLVSQLVDEITLRYELQQTLEFNNRTLEKRIAQRTSELRKVNRSLSMLSQCNRAMLYAKTEEQLLQDICHLLVGPGGYPLVWAGMSPNDTDDTIHLKAYAGEDPEYGDVLLSQWNDKVNAHGPVKMALESGKYLIQDNLEICGPTEPWRIMMNRYEFTGFIVLPVFLDNEATGTLVIFSSKKEVFDASDIELLQEMAADLSFGITALRTTIAREFERAELVKFSTALQQTADIVIITDNRGVTEYVNPAFEHVTGYTLDEAVGRTPGDLIGGGPGKRGNISDMWNILKHGEVYRGTFVNRKKDGSFYYEQKTITPIKNGMGEVSYFLSTGKDITGDLEMQERLRKVLNYDVLTGLANRNLFMDRLEQLYEQAQWEHRQLAIAIVNIDRFKNINSSLGHKVGDEVIRSIAKRLIDYFRPVDVVARLTGNTFAIIMLDQGNIEEVVQYTQEFLNYMAAPLFALGEEVMVSACVGVAISRLDCQDASQLLRNAESAMYHAKQRGPNQIEFYDKRMNNRSSESLSLEVALRHALGREEFLLFYQPKVDLLTEKVMGVEALIRWRHPKLGLVSPVDFIPLLEQTGLIVQVGQWVLEEACRQLRLWDKEGFSTLQMSLNLSSHQFLHKSLVNDFSRFIENHGIEDIKGRLELEITESSFMHDLQHGLLTLKKLKEMGFRIAIDDFGTGYSSLSYLSRLPADVLKIDRSFISNIPQRTDDVEIVRAILALAKSLHLDVVAEGIETREQQVFLLENGCDLAQGFYYSKPQPADELSAYLHKALHRH